MQMKPEKDWFTLGGRLSRKAILEGTMEQHYAGDCHFYHEREGDSGTVLRFNRFDPPEIHIDIANALAAQKVKGEKDVQSKT